MNLETYIGIKYYEAFTEKKHFYLVWYKQMRSQYTNTILLL
jgi:hypothetical protein